METFDPYQVLGLAPGASSAEIRKAFRRLAMDWHPDRNPDPMAGERFRLIRGAHDALLEQVDSPTTGGGGPVEEGVLWVSFEEAIFGARKPFSLWRTGPCGDCDGQGEVVLGFSRLCPACQGSGKIRQQGRLSPCGVCQGRGYRRSESCPGCDGTGQLRVEKALVVGVPPLCREGRILRLAGAGLAGAPESICDLLLVVRYGEHPVFERAGDDLLLDMPVSALAWLAGQRWEVPVPGGTVSAPVSHGISRPIVLPGQGLPRGQGQRGDLRVTLLPVMPQDLPPAVCQGLLALDAQLGVDVARHFPDVWAWRQRCSPRGQAGG